MSNPRAAWSPVKGFVRPSLGFHCSKSILYTDKANCLYFNNLKFGVFDAGGLQCHFITSVAIAVRIRTFSVH